MAVKYSEMPESTRLRLLGNQAKHHRDTNGLAYNSPELYNQLKGEGFPEPDLRNHANTRGGDKPAEPENKPLPPPTGPRRTPAAKPPARGRPDLPGSVAGLMLALIAYPPFLVFVKSGPTGLKDWFLAKFLNKTQPGTSAGLNAQQLSKELGNGHGGWKSPSIKGPLPGPGQVLPPTGNVRGNGNNMTGPLN